MAALPTTNAKSVRVLHVLAVIAGALLAIALVILLHDHALQATGHHAAGHFMHLPETLRILVLGSTTDHIAHHFATH